MALSCLIVDDNLDYGLAARILLEDDGIVVVGIATSSDGAVRHVEDLQPDVALLDINLGDESGFDVARRLAGMAHLAHPPSMIFISTVDGDQFAELIEASPAVGFIPKARLSAHAIHAMLADDGESTASG
jgi:CheY-like chemotaxis protein